MSKKKKESARPRFVCPKCRLLWISCNVECVICGISGSPLNEGAEKLIAKYNNKEEIT